jgi:predicted permease
VLQILFITFPFFALVLAGYVAARRRMLPLEAIPGLNGFVLYFALPCMLFRFGSTTPLAHLLDPALALTYLLCALVMVGFVVAVSLNHRIGWNDAAFGALVASFPNTGFMGVPLLVALLGNAAAGPAIVTIVVDLVVTSSLCIALSRIDTAPPATPAHPPLPTGSESPLPGGASPARVAARNALKGVIANPMPWAIVLGAVASAVQLELPRPVMQTISLLADAASPVALFTIGAVLARSAMMVASPLITASSAGGHVGDRASTGPHYDMPLRDYLPVALVKLLVHPLLVLLVGAAAIRLGLPIDRFALTVIVLVAALPSASNVSLLAEKFGANNGRIARIILVSTVLSFLTFSAAVALLT